jgi:hypothetical protein
MRAVTVKKITPNTQPVGFEAVVTACHNLSASGAFFKLAERGGFEPAAHFFVAVFRL